MLSYFLSLALRSLMLFCSGASSRLPRACICLLRDIGKFVLSSLLLHHWILYFFSFLIFVSFLSLLEGHHCFITMLMFGFSLCLNCSVATVAAAIIAAIPESLFSTTIAFTHKVGGVLIFKFFYNSINFLIFNFL